MCARLFWRASERVFVSVCVCACESLSVCVCACVHMCV